MTRRILPVLAFAVALVLALIVAVADMARADNIAASGDIANPPAAAQHADQATAALLSRTANGVGLVLTLGDNQYECGELANFQGAYDKTWGQYKAITRPSPGNHEYVTGCGTTTSGATSEANEADRTMSAAQAAGADYYSYFGDRTAPHPGYYSYDFQGWHFVALNTTFTVMTATQQAAQLAWFKADLKAHRANKCTVVYGHHPYKATASPFTSTPGLADYWPTMVLEDVDLYLSGHNHSAEEGQPIRTAGNIDTTAGPGTGGDGHMGVRWVVAGLGGRSIIPFSGTPTPSSMFRFAGSYAIFKIVPNYPAAGQWVHAFKTTDGRTLDRHAYRCH